MANTCGNLEVLVLQGLGLKDVESFGKMDPYCIVELSGQKFKTKAKTDAGKNPTWNERFLMLNVTPTYSTELQISVWDSNTTTSDTLVGTARVPMTNVYKAGTSEVRAQLVTKKGKSAGEVSLLFTFKPNAQAGMAAAPAQQPAVVMQPVQQQQQVYYAAPPQAAPVFAQAPAPVVGYAPAAPQYVAMQPAAYAYPPAPVYYQSM